MDFFSLISTYGYFIIFPISIAEGPILTIICGFLTTLGALNPFFVYPIVVFGDIVGDFLHYAAGRWLGRRILVGRVGRFFGVTDAKLEQAQEFFTRHHNKAIFLSKIIQGVGASGLIAAGSLKIPYWRFFRTCLVISLGQSFVFLLVGMFFGQAYMQIGRYLNYFASATMILGAAVVLYFLVKRIKFKA